MTCGEPALSRPQLIFAAAAIVALGYLIVAAIIWRDFAGRGIVESASDQLASRSSSDASSATRADRSPSIDDSASAADRT